MATLKSKAALRARDFEDGGGVVTGTADITEATAFMREYMHANYCAPGCHAEDCQEWEWITDSTPVVERGRIVTTSDRWEWRGRPADTPPPGGIEKRGTVVGVVWYF